MHDSRKPQRPPRSAVLIVVDGDGYLEAFAERNIDVKVVRVPHCPGAAAMAEDYTALSLPRRYRELYFPSKRRVAATTRPLLPSTIAEANQVQTILDDLNKLAEELKPAPPIFIPIDGAANMEGQTTWMS